MRLGADPPPPTPPPNRGVCVCVCVGGGGGGGGGHEVHCLFPDRILRVWLTPPGAWRTRRRGAAACGHRRMRAVLFLNGGGPRSCPALGVVIVTGEGARHPRRWYATRYCSTRWQRRTDEQPSASVPLDPLYQEGGANVDGAWASGCQSPCLQGHCSCLVCLDIGCRVLPI